MLCEKISVVYGDIIYGDLGCHLVSLEMKNDYKFFRDLVFGGFDIIQLSDDLVLLVNDESKINDMKLSCIFIYNEISVNLVFGPFILCGRSGEDFTSLPSNVKVFYKGGLVCCSQ